MADGFCCCGIAGLSRLGPGEERQERRQDATASLNGQCAGNRHPNLHELGQFLSDAAMDPMPDLLVMRMDAWTRTTINYAAVQSLASRVRPGLRFERLFIFLALTRKWWLLQFFRTHGRKTVAIDKYFPPDSSEDIDATTGRIEQ